MIPPGVIFLIGALLIPLFKGKVRTAYLLLIPALALVDIASLQPQESYAYNFLGMQLLLLKVDKLSLFIGYIFTIIGFLNILYSIYVKNGGEHFASFLYIGSSLSVVFAGDFFTLVVFWEIMAISSTMLIWFQREKESLDAAYRYILMHVFGGGMLIGGVMINYVATGSLDVGPVTGGLAYLLLFIGIGVNAAFILLHTWLPDSYPRATFTGSVFLSVYTTKTAVYVLARTFSGAESVAIMGGVMAIYGVTMALMQSDARKLLSYHIVSQVGYMVAGVGLGTALSVNGGIAHVFNHILYKALLFMTIGAVIYRTGIKDIHYMGGLARKMPVTTIAFVIAALSISGFPGFNGFVSKGMVLEATHENTLLWTLLELASIGTFLSFLKLGYYGFFKENKNIKAEDAPLAMKLSMGATATLCVVLGVYPALMLGILPYEAEYHPFELERVAETLVLFMVTGIVFIAGIRIFEPHPGATRDVDRIYRRAGNGFLWFINNPLASASQWTVTVLQSIADYLIWLGKNPTRAILLYAGTAVFKLLGRFPGMPPHASEKLLEEEWKNYPGEPVRKSPIGDSVILVLIFMAAYAIYYYLVA